MARISALALATLGLVLLLGAQANPASFPSGVFDNKTLSDGTVLSFFIDLQTFSAAQSTCMTYGGQVGVLASVADGEEWDAIIGLTNAFWASTQGSNYASAPKGYDLGFQNSSLFSGCAWIGMTNMQAHLSDPDAVAFIDGTPLTDYVANFRNADGNTVRVTGWAPYGSYDQYATCSMFCPSPNPTQQALGYGQIVLGDCTSVGLPFICKYNPHTTNHPAVASASAAAAASAWATRAMEIQAAFPKVNHAAPADAHAAPADSHSTPAAVHHRKLMSGGSGPTPVTSGETATEHGLMYTQVIELESANSHVAWPPVPEQIPTVMPGVNASCVPMGAFSYCSFPSNIVLTQADWTYICYEAGLIPFSIDTYADFVTAMQMRVPDTTGFIFAGTSADALNSVYANLYTEADYLNELYANSLAGTHEPLSQWTWTYYNGFSQVSLPPFNTTGALTPYPGYSYLGRNGTQVANNSLTCGPAGYGFGCANAIAFKSGAALALSSISAGQRANGLCKKPYFDQPSPRPTNGAAVVVNFNFVFEMPWSQLDAFFPNGTVTPQFNTSTLFIADLAKLAVPAALPGVAPYEVNLPGTGPISLVATKQNTSDHNTTNGIMYAMVMITLPFTVNTTTNINNYLFNLINHTMEVLPPYFIERWHVVNATGFVAATVGVPGNGALSLAPSFTLLATIAASLLMLLGSML